MGNVVNGFDLSDNGLKVGVVQYAEFPKTEFSLNSLKNKEETLTMLEMLSPLKEKPSYIGRAIRHVSNIEFQPNKGARDECNKIVVIFTDGFSQDEIKEYKLFISEIIQGVTVHICQGDVVTPGKRALSEGRRIGREFFVVKLSEEIDLTQFFADFENQENILNLNDIETMKTIIGNRLVQKRCKPLLEETSHGIDSNNLQYNVTCERTRISIHVKTMEPFRGKIFIRGYADNLHCRQLQDSFSVNQNMILMLPIDDCGIRTGFQMSPLGVYLETTLIISFHPVFITKLDRSINIRCFFSDNSTQLTSLTLSNENVKAKVFYPFTPNCSYTIHLNSEQGPLASVVSVGQKVFHVWECKGSQKHFTVHVHSCTADDGQQTKTLLLNNRGCSNDFNIWPTITYNRNYTKVWQQVEAFKFPGGTLMFFTCQLSFCDVDDTFCQESYTPFVNCQLNVTKRSVLEENTIDLYTKISVVEMTNDENLPRKQIKTMTFQKILTTFLYSSDKEEVHNWKFSVTCINSFQATLIVTLSFSIWITIVCYFALRITGRRQTYDLDNM